MSEIIIWFFAKFVKLARLKEEKKKREIEESQFFHGIFILMEKPEYQATI